MQPWDAYLLYNALKLHFESDSYDALKYNFKTSAKAKSFVMRKDRFFFAKLAKKYPDKDQLTDYLTANFVSAKGTLWSGDLVKPEAEESYREWRGRMETFTYRFNQDLDSIAQNLELKGMKSLDDALVSRANSYPFIVVLANSKTIMLETVVVFDLLTNFLENAKITETIFWPGLSRKIHKYKPFLGKKTDLKKLRKAIIQRFTS
jgi:hypothetical protein